MSDDTKAMLAFLVVGLAFGGFSGFVFTGKYALNYAIEEGHAEYYLDTNHARQWRWKTNCVQEVKP